MNMKYLFSFLCLCCVLSVSAQKPVVINLAKAISESPKEIMLNELASDIRYVPLETTDDCLMNNEFYTSCSIQGKTLLQVAFSF